MDGCSSSGVGSWTVIVHQSLKDTAIDRVMQRKVARIRGSDSLVEGAIVFPACKTAFLVVRLTAPVTETIWKSSTVSQGAQDVCKAFDRYMKRDVDFLLAHNAEECVAAMITISVPQSPPVNESAHKKFCACMTQMVNENIPGPHLPHAVNSPGHWQ